MERYSFELIGGSHRCNILDAKAIGGNGVIATARDVYNAERIVEALNVREQSTKE